ncbi:hypothetical protein QQS21_004917, partial [Conoideocrella luteorostrata]
MSAFWGTRVSDMCQGFLVGTSSHEMFAVANATLDLLTLELVLHQLSVGVLSRPWRACASSDDPVPATVRLQVYATMGTPSTSL